MIERARPAIDRALRAVTEIDRRASVVAAMEQAESAAEFLSHNPAALDRRAVAIENLARNRAAVDGIQRTVDFFARNPAALDEVLGKKGRPRRPADPPRCTVQTDRPLRRVRRESLTGRADLRYRRFSRCIDVAISTGRCRADGRRVRMEPLPAGSPIEYERPHVRERMARFGITDEQIRATLEQPDQIRPALERPPTDPCNIYLRSIDGRRCKVYVRIGSDPMRVATVRWHGE